MKKLALCLLLTGLIVAAAAIGIGIMVRDNEEVQAISAVTGIRITPENGVALRQEALDRGLNMSGIVDFVLRVYPYVGTVSVISAGVAAVGLLLLILAIIIKPLLSIMLLLVIAAVLYFGYQGNLGPEVRNFVQMVVTNAQNYLTQIVSFAKELPIEETINRIVGH